MADASSFYITTPIFYVNDVPHIGHAYTEVAADVLARWNRQAGRDTWMLTGTDEHGQKILRTATANGVTPKEWADKLVTDAWKPLLETVDIANDDFIRTTEERHEVNVQQFLQKLYDDGHIYTGEYEGYYCVGCEEYKQQSELVDGTGEYEGQLVCAIHSKPVELLHEKNYFFRMSAFQDKLLALYEERPDFVQPDSARNEVVSFVRQGLADLSISRSTFDWGVKVPWDESHVVYVWFDALLNYITAVGYGQDDEEFARRWPAQHLVGKDILRFHAVIWPAMLLAAGLEVPTGVFGHGWLLVGGEKMSKSKLTGIAPSQITDTFGSDAFRFYFLSRDPLRPGRLVLVGGPLGALPGRARERLRQPRLPRDRHDQPLLRGRGARRRRAERGRPRDRAHRARGDGCLVGGHRAPADPRGHRGRVDARRRTQRIHHGRGALGARQGLREARPPRDRARDRLPRARHARRAALAGAAEGHGEAVDSARRRRLRAGPAHRPRARVGHAARESPHWSRCSRAWRSPSDRARVARRAGSSTGGRR